jgi:hypothetical protein
MGPIKTKGRNAPRYFPETASTLERRVNREVRSVIMIKRRAS